MLNLMRSILFWAILASIMAFLCGMYVKEGNAGWAVFAAIICAVDLVHVYNAIRDAGIQ